jgi:serine/threonine protein kinase/Tfp pilus assembly protein PilF
MSLIGKTIGHIRIVESIGHGGMGEVYTGYDDALERKVAVKVIGARSRLNAESKARFLREARVLSQLDHPNICRIHDYIDGEETDFLVLEYIEGKSLRQAINEGLDKRQKLKIAEEIVRVLLAAHAKGVVHRDLKPSNIMLTNLGEVKVLDFGIARHLKGPPEEVRKEGQASVPPEAPATLKTLSPEDVTLTLQQPPRPPEKNQPQRLPDLTFKTTDGTIVGTPSYMSPEQARGEEVGAASDMYSLGLLLQELYTGQTPVDETADSGTALDWARQAKSKPIAGVSSDLAELINRLKSPIPTARPTAIEAADRLRRIREKPKRIIRRIAAAAILTAVVLAGLKYTIDLRRERGLAIQARDEVISVVEFLVDLFEVSDPGEARGNTITAREILDKGAREIEQGLREQPLTRARLMGTIGIVYQKLGLYPSAEPLLKRALEIREESLGKEDLQVAESLNSLAVLSELKGEYDKAESLARQGLEIRRKKLSSSDPAVAESLHEIGRINHRRVKFADARDYYNQALAIREQALGAKHPKVADSLIDLGALNYQETRFEEAEKCFQRALAIREEVYGTDHPDVGRSLTSLADLYSYLRRFKDAEPLYQRALAIREKTLGAFHPEVADCLNNIAVFYYYQERYEEAEKLYLQALDIQKKALGENHPDVAESLENIGILYHKIKRYAEAEPYYRQSLAVREKIFGPDHPELIRCLNNLGFLLPYSPGKERIREAEALHLRALDISEKEFGPDHLRTRRPLANLGYHYQDTGQPAKAAPLFERVLAILEKERGPDDKETQKAAKEYIDLLKSLGREKEAEELAAKFRIK